MNRKEYMKKWQEDNKEHIRHYKKEYAKTHDSSFKKLQDKYKQLEQENKQLREVIVKVVLELVNIDGNLSSGQLSDRICNLIDILKEVSK